jgi:hypothetical protein
MISPLEEWPDAAGLPLEAFWLELSQQLSPPSAIDLVALTMGHSCLLTVAFAAFWAYLTMRLWRLHRASRSRWMSHTSFLQVRHHGWQAVTGEAAVCMLHACLGLPLPCTVYGLLLQRCLPWSVHAASLLPCHGAESSSRSPAP